MGNLLRNAVYYVGLKRAFLAVFDFFLVLYRRKNVVTLNYLISVYRRLEKMENLPRNAVYCVGLEMAFLAVFEFFL